MSISGVKPIIIISHNVFFNEIQFIMKTEGEKKRNRMDPSGDCVLCVLVHPISKN